MPLVQYAEEKYSIIFNRFFFSLINPINTIIEENDGHILCRSYFIVV